AVAALAGKALDATHEAVARRIEPATDLDVVAAREVELLVVEPPGHVEVHAADTILVVRDVIDHRGDEPRDVRSGGVGDVLADHAAGVGEALREERRL